MEDDTPKPKGKRGNPAWQKKGDSPNPGGVSKKQREDINKARIGLLRITAAAITELELLLKDDQAKIRLDAAKTILSLALPKLAPMDLDGEVVRDEVINVIIPDYGDDEI